MYRGTTPKFSLKLETDISFDDIEECYVTIASKIVNLTIGKDRLDFNDEMKRIELTLTQEETLQFHEGNAEIQVRIKLKDGTALASTIDKTVINKILKNGVI